MNDEKYVLLCEKCSKDIGITTEELSNAIMLPKPLTNDEIVKAYADMEGMGIIDFARTLEKIHGIL
jgi:hypothetical protein